MNYINLLNYRNLLIIKLFNFITGLNKYIVTKNIYKKYKTDNVLGLYKKTISEADYTYKYSTGFKL